MPTEFRGMTVHRDTVLRAMAAFDAEYPNPNDYQSWLDNRTYLYAVVHADRPYPPKHILSEITGVPTADFTGGDVTNRVFRELGFPILDLRGKLPTWHRDEAILLLDLYLRLAEQGKAPLNLPHDAPEITELSETLRRLPLHGAWTHVPGLPQSQRHPHEADEPRQPRPQPQREGPAGRLSTRSRHLDHLRPRPRPRPPPRHQHPPALRDRRSQQAQTTSPAPTTMPPTPTLKAGCSTASTESVNATKRSSDKKKQQASSLACEVCGFDFHATYGELGRDYAECHHTKPISTMQPGDTTKLADLAIVCANCHRMLHRPNPNDPSEALTIDGLREILAT